jgi:RHS repeat-associated protein
LNALVIYMSGSTNALNQSTSGVYDCNTGLLTSYTDANANTSSFTYDPMNRIQTASYPDGGSTTFNYTDAQNTVSRSIAATPNPTEATTVIFDGFGRERHRITSDSPSNDTVDTTYDLNGRVSSVSNPYRSTGDPTYGISSYTYDAMGRKVLQCQPDDTTDHSVCSSTTQGNSFLQWSYNGPTVTSVDEDGNSWVRTSDSLGRLTTVVEPTNLTTSYVYNPRSDLTDVNQYGVVGQDATRSRHFLYDSLSRLLTANNPETGTICYGQWNGTNCQPGYDANGNLLAKTDARGITSNYNYDFLNRVTSKTYTDGTPEADYSYDATGVNGIGRLTAASVGGANVYSLYYYQYDPVGRQGRRFQLPNSTGTGLQPGVGGAGDFFDAAGHVIFTDNGTGVYEFLVRDSAGHVITAYSEAATTSPLDGVASTTLFVDGTYTPLGAPSSRLLGNGLTETRGYDHRGRWTSNTQGVVGSPAMYSVTTGYDPAGNVTSVNDSVNGNWSYVYDSLNRLHQGFSAAGLDLDWEYDSFGNRKSQTPSGTGSAPQMNLPFTNPTNRVDPGNNIAYDGAGNVTTDNQGQTYTYDAEERISSMTHLGGPPTIYKYDSEGNLVYERGPDTAQIFLRNTAGQPILIISPDNAAEPFWNTEAYVDGERLGDWDNGPFFFAGTDAVGTKRISTWGWGDVNTGAIPVLAETSTSLPYGDALSSIGFDPMHFTGKMRDIESGNDYFGARYYASSMGRFMSPDWADKPEAVPYSSLDNPQSLNLYGYVNNNPLSKVDKDGHCLEDACVVEGAVAIVAFGALTVSTYLQTPSGQRSLANAASSASAAISSTFHSIFSKSDTPVPEVVVDGNKHPESAQHVAEAQAAGHPAEVTIDRGNAKTNRAEALKGTPAVPGKQRDEYPPASTQEGGGGASVRPINGSDNAGSGASYGNQIRPFADGTKIRITPINVPKPPQ